MLKYLIILILTICNFSFAQNKIVNSNDFSRITLNAILPVDTKVPIDSRVFLENKLNQIITYNGLGGTNLSNSRFIISASLNEINNEQLSESLQFYYNLDVVLYIVDVFENNIFSTTSLNIKGVGNTQIKAYNDAIKRIDPQSNAIQIFLNNGKAKIVELYNKDCDFIQSSAHRLAKLNKFDEALYNLELVPKVCSSCYNASSISMIEIYKQKINFECQTLLAKSKGLISVDNYDEAGKTLSTITPNADCFKEAQAILKEVKDHKCSINLGKAKGALASYDFDGVSKYLSEIPVDSKCGDDANKIIEEAKNVALKKDSREWKFKLKIQNDENFNRNSAIDAARAIGVAFGKSQPKTNIYNNFRSIW